jgi:hypothetical protein
MYWTLKINKLCSVWSKLDEECWVKEGVQKIETAGTAGTGQTLFGWGK